MPDSISTAQITAYKNAVDHLLQQKESRLAGKVTHDSYVGKEGVPVEQFGAVAAQKRTSRHSDTPLLNITQARRWVHPVDYEWASLIDNVDKLRLNIQPEGPYTQAAAMAHQRVKDIEILGAFFATSVTGETGTGTEAFDTTNYRVGVDVGGTASGLNAAKIKNALFMLMLANKGDVTEQAYMAISAYEHDLLLKEIQVINKDYNGGAAVLENGAVKRFAGFEFGIMDNDLFTITSGNRLIPSWVKSGMHMGTWQDFLVRIAERADKGHSWQVYTCQTLGATRLQQGKVVQVLCDDQI
ncbi:MAG: phage capsid protein [Dehalococcoidia bacterium]